jgi:hypothetical protein
MLLIWALLEASEITRLNTNVEEDNTPAVAECGSKKGHKASIYADNLRDVMVCQ